MPYSMLSPDRRNEALAMSLLSAGGQMMQAAGPRPYPISLAGALGQGMQGFSSALGENMGNALKYQMLARQLAKEDEKQKAQKELVQYLGSVAQMGGLGGGGGGLSEVAAEGQPGLLTDLTRDPKLMSLLAGHGDIAPMVSMLTARHPAERLYPTAGGYQPAAQAYGQMPFSRPAAPGRLYPIDQDGQQVYGTREEALGQHVGESPTRPTALMQNVEYLMREANLSREQATALMTQARGESRDTFIAKTARSFATVGSMKVGEAVREATKLADAVYGALGGAPAPSGVQPPSEAATRPGPPSGLGVWLEKQYRALNKTIRGKQTPQPLPPRSQLQPGKLYEVPGYGDRIWDGENFVEEDEEE